jgi:hypothetical protein
MWYAGHVLPVSIKFVARVARFAVFFMKSVRQLVIITRICRPLLQGCHHLEPHGLLHAALPGTAG